MTDGKITITAGSVTDAAENVITYGEPVSGTEYTVSITSDNYTPFVIKSVYIEEIAAYLLMNVPYADLYKDVDKSGADYDAVSSATQKKDDYFITGKPGDDGELTNAPAAYGADNTIKGVKIPVAVTKEQIEKLDKVTDANADYYYEEIAADVQQKVYMAVKIAADGTKTFTWVQQPESLTDTEVTINSASAHGDFLVTVNENGADKFLTYSSDSDKDLFNKTFKVYAVTLTDNEGKTYGLRHLSNLYYKDFNQFAFCTVSDKTAKGFTDTHKDYFGSLAGKNINKIVYYTNNGVYEIRTDTAVTQTEYVLMNIPYDVFYSAEIETVKKPDGTKIDIDYDAVSSATYSKPGNYGISGGAYHSGTTASSAEDGTVTAVGKDSKADNKGVIWPVKVEDASALAKLGGTEKTDEDTVTVAASGKGGVSSANLKGYHTNTQLK